MRPGRDPRCSQHGHTQKWPLATHSARYTGGGRSSPPGPPLLLACARHPHQHTANVLAACFSLWATYDFFEPSERVSYADSMCLRPHTASQQHLKPKLQLASETPHHFKTLSSVRGLRTTFVVNSVRIMSIAVISASCAKTTVRGGQLQPQECTEQSLPQNLTVSAGIGAFLHCVARGQLQTDLHHV